MYVTISLTIFFEPASHMLFINNEILCLSYHFGESAAVLCSDTDDDCDMSPAAPSDACSPGSRAGQ